MRINEILVVEGKYDAAKLSGLVDGLILTTGGFSIYKDEEKRALISSLGKKRGIIILTDSDAAGFRIRTYIQNFAKGAVIKNAYVPAVAGKESRKSTPSKEGTLGVEGLPNDVLLEALRRAGATQEKPREGRLITYTDLFLLGISGTQGSAERRRMLLHTIGLPLRLSKKAVLETLNATYTYEELVAICNEKPVLFWDFHGTLTLPDHTWTDTAYAALKAAHPESAITWDDLHAKFRHRCLPWWVCKGEDTKFLLGKGAWWRFVEEGFVEIYKEFGISENEAKRLVKALRPALCAPANHRLRHDAVEVLATLQKRGYRQYLLSNNFPELPEIITALGLAPYFSGLIVSGAIGLDKPHKNIYDYALALAGHPAQAIMIGDNPDDDVRGAKNAGLGAIGVDRAVGCPQADDTVKTLSELLEILT
ncbi:MAG: HAD-IA family hydrolase [Pygmaiobacter sp.]